MSSSDSHGSVAATIIEMERDALRRWIKGDPNGFLEICAPLSASWVVGGAAPTHPTV